MSFIVFHCLSVACERLRFGQIQQMPHGVDGSKLFEDEGKELRHLRLLRRHSFQQPSEAVGVLGIQFPLALQSPNVLLNEMILHDVLRESFHISNQFSNQLKSIEIN